jgi:hypothetical protein
MTDQSSTLHAACAPSQADAVPRQQQESTPSSDASQKTVQRPKSNPFSEPYVRTVPKKPKDGNPFVSGMS